MLPDLEKMMTAAEQAQCGVARLSPAEREALVKWGLRVFSLGQHVVSEVDKIKYEGHLVVLNDGSRWEVSDLDKDTAALWDELDKVVVIDGEMYNIENAEKVEVTEAED